MKRNLKIMGSKPEITDREIQQFMNFDKLLHDQQHIAAQGRKKQLIKNSLIATGIVATAIVAILLMSDQPSVTSEKSPVPVTTPQTQKHSPNQLHDTVAEVQEPSAEIPRKADEKAAINPDQKAPAIEDSKETKKESVYLQAEPVDGFPLLYEYFKKELRYPEASLKDSLEGVVTVIFSIDINGRPQNLQIENSLGEAFDEEVKRVINNMPQWKPASYNGTPVNSKVSVPLTFNIEKIEK